MPFFAFEEWFEFFLLYHFDIMPPSWWLGPPGIHNLFFKIFSWPFKHYCPWISVRCQLFIFISAVAWLLVPKNYDLAVAQFAYLCSATVFTPLRSVPVICLEFKGNFLNICHNIKLESTIYCSNMWQLLPPPGCQACGRQMFCWSLAFCLLFECLPPHCIALDTFSRSPFLRTLDFGHFPKQSKKEI